VSSRPPQAGATGHHLPREAGSYRRRASGTRPPSHSSRYGIVSQTCLCPPGLAPPRDGDHARGMCDAVGRRDRSAGTGAERCGAAGTGVPGARPRPVAAITRRTGKERDGGDGEGIDGVEPHVARATGGCAFEGGTTKNPSRCICAATACTPPTASAGSHTLSSGPEARSVQGADFTGRRPPARSSVKARASPVD